MRYTIRLLGILWISLATTIAAITPSPNQGFVFNEKPDIISKARKVKTVISKQEISAKQLQVFSSRTMFADISDSIKLLPGVVGGGEFDANMYIRGGGPDELLYVVDDHFFGNGGRRDGATAFGGRLTRINSKLVDRLTFYSGGTPARYGNALSGVLDVTYKTGSTTKTSFDFDQNMTELNWVGQGPIEQGKSSWLAAYKRTYYDLVAGLFFPAGTQVPYLANFYGKYYNELTPDQKLIISYDNTSDGAHLSEESFKKFSDATGSLSYDNNSQDFNAWLESTWATTSTTKLGVGYAESTLHAETAQNATSTSVRLGRKRYSVGGEWTYSGIEHHKLNSGVYVFLQRISLYENTLLSPGSFFGQTTTQNYINDYGPVNSTYYAVYTQDEWQVLPELAINAGIRHEKVPSLTQGSVLQPRVTAYIGDRQKTALMLSVGRFTDFDFELFDNKLVDLAPRQAIHYVVGVEQHSGDQWLGRIETYYKDYSQMVDATQNAQTGEVLGYNNDGKGTAYGIEFFLQKSEPSKVPGTWSGWISYSLSRVQSYTPSRGWYSPPQDVTHVLNITGDYQWGEKLKLLTTFSISTGKVYTDIVGRTFNPGLNRYLPVWGDYQGARLPMYCRLDIWAEYLEPSFPLRWWFSEGKQYIGLGNILNYRNISGYTWSSDYAQRQDVTDFNSGISLIAGTQVRF